MEACVRHPNVLCQRQKLTIETTGHNQSFATLKKKLNTNEIWTQAWKASRINHQYIQ